MGSIQQNNQNEFVSRLESSPNDAWRMFRVMGEFVEGFENLGQYSNLVSVFGSARFTGENIFYKEAEKLGHLLVESGYGVVTGGGSGHKPAFVGYVGKKVAAAGRELGMKVLLNDPPRARAEGDAEFVNINEIISQSDIITIHVPLEYDGSDPTYHLAGKDFISRLQKHQFLVNASRGEVVDNAALRDALKSRSIAGAALDVWENENNFDVHFAFGQKFQRIEQALRLIKSVRPELIKTTKVFINY